MTPGNEAFAEAKRQVVSFIKMKKKGTYATTDRTGTEVPDTAIQV